MTLLKFRQKAGPVLFGDYAIVLAANAAAAQFPQFEPVSIMHDDVTQIEWFADELDQTAQTHAQMISQNQNKNVRCNHDLDHVKGFAAC